MASFRPEIVLTNHRFAHHCSLHNVTADISVFLCLFMNQQKIEVIFVHQNLISNRLTYAKSTGELIGFGFSDPSVRSQRNAQLIAETKRKTTSLFGLSLVSVRI